MPAFLISLHLTVTFSISAHQPHPCASHYNARQKGNLFDCSGYSFQPGKAEHCAQLAFHLCRMTKMLLNYAPCSGLPGLVSALCPQWTVPSGVSVQVCTTPKASWGLGSEQHTSGQQLPPLKRCCKMDGRDGTCHHHGNPSHSLGTRGRQGLQSFPFPAPLGREVALPSWFLLQERGLFMRNAGTQGHRQPPGCLTSCCN